MKGGKLARDARGTEKEGEKDIAGYEEHVSALQQGERAVGEGERAEMSKVESKVDG